MQNKKLTITVSIVCMLFSLMPTKVFAWGWSFTGGPVIDWVRLNDSIRETAEMVKAATNQTLMKVNQELINAGIDLSGIYRDTMDVMNSVKDTMKTKDNLTNKWNNLDNLEFYKSNDYSTLDAIFKYQEKDRKLIQSSDDTNNNFGKAISKAGSTKTKLDEELSKLLNQQSKGGKSEFQIRNSISLNTAFQAINDGNLKINKIMKDLEDCENAYAQGRLRIENSKATMVPTLSKEQIRDDGTKNLGFKQIKK